MWSCHHRVQASTAHEDHRQATGASSDISSVRGFLPMVVRPEFFKRSQKCGLWCNISKCLRGEIYLKNCKDTVQGKPTVSLSHMRLVAGLRSVFCLDTLISCFRSKMTCQEHIIAVNSVEVTLVGADQGGVWIPAPDLISWLTWGQFLSLNSKVMTSLLADVLLWISNEVT